jgi:non-heme chloroperoxidase
MAEFLVMGGPVTRFVNFALLLVLAISTQARARDISGIWQGTADGKHVLKVSKAPNGGIRGELYYLGREGDYTLSGNSISSIAVKGATVSFRVDRYLTGLDGMIAPDGKSISGTWHTYNGSLPVVFERATKKSAWVIDSSLHKVRFVTVEKGVRLEVLDWGGSGPPVIFLSGLENSAHAFDDFAPNFTRSHHVYGITRRGFGLSSTPPVSADNYNPDRLGDDVLAVISALKLNKPILVGHSIAGQELSSVGTRHPEMVAGLVYLDAANAYAYYDPDSAAVISIYANAAALQRDFAHLWSADQQHKDALIQDIQATIPRLQKELAERSIELDGPAGPSWVNAPQDQINDMILISQRKYSRMDLPILAIVAVPQKCAPNCELPGVKAANATKAQQADAFEKGNPTARVVRLAYATHYVFRSKEADVIREMNAFMDGLPH